MKSTGCGHDSAMRAFWFDGILLDNTSVAVNHLQKTLATLDLFGLHESDRTPTPPPRNLLS